MENANYIEVKSFQTGEVIFREGDPGDCMYDIQKGEVGVYSMYGTSDEKLIARLGADNVFGEMGMVEGLPRSATVAALSDHTEIAVITWNVLGRYFKTKPSRVVQMMQQMSDRLRKQTADYENALRTIEKASRSLEEDNANAARSELRKYLRRVNG